VLLNALRGLRRYVATTETAKHRIFQFLSAEILPDHMILAFASDDAFHLGVLSSRAHMTWTLRMGGTLEDRPRYNKKVCFDPFPFPVPSPEAIERIRGIAEDLDAHRKRQQAAHPGLTMTDTYNVLAKVRAGDTLSAKDKRVHDEALATVLLRIHDALDEAVQDAYGWIGVLTDEELVDRLVALNADRAAEEATGRVQWLRPDLAAAPLEDNAAEEGDEGGDDSGPPRRPWPATSRERVVVVREALQRGPITTEYLATEFEGATPLLVVDTLDALEALGVAERTGTGWVLR
jgi:hypothetical protein